jgi:outer membrane protein OmpA-like peptidoglycan-associated protein
LRRDSSLWKLTVAAVCVAGPAFAEAYKVNAHIEPGGGAGLSPGFFVSGAALKMDLGVLKLGPVTPQVEGFGLGTAEATVLEHGTLYGAGLGVRWRILNDEKGYFFNPGGARGNLWGNLWLDAHLAIANGAPRVGLDLAFGGELSLIDGLQAGPFVKLIWLRDPLLLFGLSFSVGWPYATAAEFDPDGDGIMGAADKCPTQPEDKDGFEDDDGCPDPDNDGDGIPDVKDKCPNQPEDKDGFQDDDGCPDPDNDGDGIPDVKDRCPNEPETVNGIEDDDGCPEKDADVYFLGSTLQLALAFDTDKATLRPESGVWIDRAAAVFKRLASRRIRIEAHVSEPRDPVTNQALSLKRADAVRDALIKRGVPLSQLETSGSPAGSPFFQFVLLGSP